MRSGATPASCAISTAAANGAKASNAFRCADGALRNSVTVLAWRSSHADPCCCNRAQRSWRRRPRHKAAAARRSGCSSRRWSGMASQGGWCRGQDGCIDGFHHNILMDPLLSAEGHASAAHTHRFFRAFAEQELLHFRGEFAGFRPAGKAVSLISMVWWASHWPGRLRCC